MNSKMSDRTTINVPKSEHTAAGNVKEEYNDTWADVLSFYASFKPQVNSGGLDRGNDTDGGAWTDDDVERVRSMLETVETRTGRIERGVEDLQR